MSKKKNSQKRANGQGSISVRSDGRIMGRYTVNGKRHTIYGKKGETEADVKKRLNRILLEIDVGSFAEPSQITLAQYLPEWLKTYMFPTIRRSTYSQYEQYVTRHILPKLGSIKLQKLTQKQLQDFFNEKMVGGRLDGKPGGLAVKTLTNMYRMLHEALEHAMEGANPILAKNPLSGVKLGKDVKKEMRVLTVKEQADIQEAVMSMPDPVAYGIIFAVNTGLRIGEMLGLNWSDIDFDKHSFKVRRTAQRLDKVNFDPKTDKGPKTEVVLCEPKTESSKREIPIFDDLWDGLMEYRRKQVVMREIVGDAYQGHNLVFCNTLGGVIEPRTYEDKFKKAAKIALIKGATFHTLRHTFATRALEAGMDIKVLSVLLGHSSVSITLNLYGHVLPDHKVASMDKMKSFYRNGMKKGGQAEKSNLRVLACSEECGSPVRMKMAVDE